ncbi:hypothetical protein FKB34_08030 [Glycocaulis profundi]|nr:hypothetical protein FKB34_08030 [Glycocaulis profundi]
MTATLVIRLPAPDRADDAPVAWTLFDEDARAATGEAAPGSAPDLPPGAAPDRLIALAPADHVSMVRLLIPARSDREAAQAAPFAIEDRLAAPLETQTVAAGPAGPDGARLVMAAEAGLAARWSALVTATGIRPVHVLPDAMALETDAALALAREAGRILFRASCDELPLCGAFPEALADRMLPALIERAGEGRIVLQGFDPAVLSQAEHLPPSDLDVAAAGMDDAALRLLSPLLGPGLAARLDWAGALRPWRGAAVAAGIAGALALGAALAEGLWLDHRAQAYGDAARTAFAEAFPDVRRVVNPRAQLAQRLAAAGPAAGTGQFLDLSSTLAMLLEAAPQVRVEALRYDADRGVLAVTAVYGGFDDFETLRAAAEASGVSIEDSGARQGPDGVVGDFLVRLR